MKLDVVFVCQQGELEVMSALLAASLRQVCGSQVHLHAIAPIPQEEYGVISPLARKFLDGLDVKWYPFRNPISDAYKIFNKLNAFNIEPQGDRILFLDSDTLVRRSLQPLSKYFSRSFAAKSANKQRFSTDVETWKPVYQLFDLPVPESRWPASDSHQWGAPYFNAGVILVDPALDFSRHWIDTCLRIHLDERIKMENRGTVQVGLPVVLYRLNISYGLLDKRFNFCLSKGWLQKRRAWADDEAHIVHYFNLNHVSADPVVEYEVNELVKNFKLEDILALSPGGHKLRKSLERMNRRATVVKMPQNQSSLFTPRTAKESPSSVDRLAACPTVESRMAFITGMPRSGANLFASLLAELPDVMVLHEPKIKEALEKSENFGALGLAWKKWREDIAQAKSTPGAATSRNFVLATKNTLGYLTHLERIVNAFPQATFFVLVRHPFAAIARWMDLPYLSEAKFIEEDELAGIDSPFLLQEQRESLLGLQSLHDSAMKRAGLWDYFAGLANTHAAQVHIFRYEDMIENPAAVLRHAYAKLFPGREFKLPNMNVQNRESGSAEMLTEWNKECIRAICSNNAGAFDYQLYEF